MAFNLLVVVLFTATDMSLVSIHCADNSHTQPCSDFALAAWEGAEVRTAPTDTLHALEPRAHTLVIRSLAAAASHDAS